VTGSYWDGTPGSYPKCWAFDLHATNYTGVLWSQFMHDEAHTGSPLGPLASEVALSDPAGSISPGVLRIHPNPCLLGRRIEIGSPTGIAGAVRIYDSAGRLVRALDPAAGATWDGRDAEAKPVASGAYVLRTRRQVGRVVVVR
jgi:hypothetical protein